MGPASIHEAKARGVRFVDLAFTDIVGMAKAVTIPIDQLPRSLEEGRWFDGSAIEGFARVSESDMFLRPDPATFAIVPWEEERARIICDVERPNGEPFEGDPRARLHRLIARAAALGYRYEVAPEIEFFLLRPPDPDAPGVKPFDRGSYFDLVDEPVADFWRELMSSLEALQVPVESSHHEAADGQYEIDLVMQDALAAADAIMTSKLAIRSVATHHQIMATFLPKPIAGVNGSGMHIHQRLVHSGSGMNAFADPEDQEYNLSETGLRFIAGLLTHASGCSAIVSPLINSYKRLVPHYEAPVAINWGHQSQDMLVRVPRVSALRTGDVRVELRNPDPSCNPYLALTVILAAGLDGITRALDCPPPDLPGRRDIGSLHTAPPGHLLPQSLAAALEALEADPLMRESLGALIADQFVDAKTQEWESYRREVTAWELQRYLPLF